MNKIITVVLSLWLFSLNSYAQTVLSGIVRDADGYLVGATIEVKGTNHYGVVDTNGQFSLQLNDKLPLTLRVSLVGYKSQEVTITDLPLFH